MKKFTLLSLFILITGFAANAQINLQQGLIAYYKLNNSTLDSTTNHLNLTASGTPVGTVDRFGVTNGAYLLNSAHPDYFTTPLNALLAPVAVTVSAWVKLSNTMTDQKIAGRAVVGGGYLLGVDSNKIDAEIWDLAATHFRIKGGNVVANTWTHLVMSYQASAYLRIYINGAPVDSIIASASGAGTSATWTFTIGGAPWQPAALNANGSIDDICIYNRALNNAEVMALYTGTSATYVKNIFTTGTAALYPVPVEHGMLHVDFGKQTKGEAQVNITDALGRTVYTTTFNNPQKETLNLSTLSSGIYTVSITNQNETESHRVVVE